ncbi:hypothetical protein HC024_12455 [Methylococcaceae bacterium WWC4]|nr:hypothetical protein [Methylococcaceae bacterium WWC4]
MESLNQFKTLIELQEIIKQLRNIEKKLILARPVVRDEHPTLYANASETGYRVVCGVRVCDYQLSVDERWVEPNEQMGLSFSGEWQHLRGVHKMVSRHADKSVDVFWVLGDANLPPGMAFQEDKKKKGHYFLVVVRRMTLSALIENLQWVASRMSKIEQVEFGQ